MIEEFHSHREGFDKLLRMFQEDRSLGRVGNTFTRASNFFEKCEDPDCWNGKEIEASDERLAEYRRLFADVGLKAGIEGYGKKKSISFYRSASGLSVTGSTKGFMYTTEQYPIIVDDLDNYWSADGKSFTALKHVEGNWYLFLDYED